MEKEIPFSQERNGKQARLREARRRLQEFPLELPLAEQDWEAATADLTQDDLQRLPVLAQGHLDRALACVGTPEGHEAADEARAAVLLHPRDRAWAQKAASALKARGWNDDRAREFYSAVTRRVGRPGTKSRRLPAWVIPVAVAAAVTALVAWGSLAFWPGLNLGLRPLVPVGPRTVEAAFDTQGVKTNITVAASRMVVFPEASVAELSAWVTFPDHRVEAWEGTVSVLDAQGQSLAQREVVFIGSETGPVEPGQGIEVFQQFSAWPWFNQAASIQLVTSRILAREAQPSRREQMPVVGADALTGGHQLRVWLLQTTWSDRFASRVHSLGLEIENSGLKPFTELQFALVWIDPQGRTLKTQTLRPVSPFRTALPSGGRVAWQQESVFDTEVFPWAPGAEPHPVLELRAWQ